MPNLKVAHLHEQGQDMIIVPLDSSFGCKSGQEQSEAIGELQMRSTSAGLRGTVVPVWQSSGRMAFIAPRPWHPFFQSLSLPMVYANLNKELHR
ncbi:MAG: hypothetical protein ACR650_03960 [Methylocystis sp.]